MLRTHTSAHEVDVFRSGETKWLLTADVYRRDEIDASHYPIFHQMEGARIFSSDTSGMKEVADDNAMLSRYLSQSNILIFDVSHISSSNPAQPSHDCKHAELVAINLKLSLNSLLLHLFGGMDGEPSANKKDPLKVRWIEAYFPFTSPSYEVEVFFRGKWLEILGCGVVRQATLDRAGVPHKIGWAFGLGLERISMILNSIPDIRLFWSTDPRFLSQFQSQSLRTGNKNQSNITTFKPYSRYPACFKDVSFWLPPPEEGTKRMHENDLCDLVRDVAGDLVEDVKMIDSFTHSKSKRTSLCYRINYRSMDKSLSNEETNALHSDVVARLKNRFRVEIR